MPSIPIQLPAHSLAIPPTSPPAPFSSPSNPLPGLLHTPTGLAILEIQGTLNLPPSTTNEDVSVGHLHFPLYDYAKAGSRGEEQEQDGGGRWMKLVYLEVGGRQRMTGEVKRLDKPVAVLRKKEGAGEKGGEELEIVEVVRWKVIFSNRPEPVG